HIAHHICSDHSVCDAHASVQTVQYHRIVVTVDDRHNLIRCRIDTSHQPTDESQAYVCGCRAREGERATFTDRRYHSSVVSPSPGRLRFSPHIGPYLPPLPPPPLPLFTVSNFSICLLSCRSSPPPIIFPFVSVTLASLTQSAQAVLQA